ncbi:hypothetical protein IWW38_005364 [Coemansia aciculifera]|uniref:Uncharacterized protein n=1 Tax=Coemansia aciculifera TaxID=417176 RepID=A0ACC1LVU0_9FUNG|nr:hypothetical protein IWW38_005364 [Coemansia aciculifera]
MSRLGAHWQVSSKCHSMLSALVRTNGIGLDQSMEEDEDGNGDEEKYIQAIKDHCIETSRIAYAVYENRALHRERSSMPTTRSSAAPLASAFGANHDGVPKSADSPGLPIRKATTRARDRTTMDVLAVPAQQSLHEHPPKAMLAEALGTCNKIELSREATLPTSLLQANPPVTAAMLGQFVPSLEFFANADFPLGLGGPNGQASIDLPFRDGAQCSHLSDMSSLSTLSSMPAASSTACPINIADSYGSSGGGVTDVFGASLLGAQGNMPDVFSVSAQGMTSSEFGNTPIAGSLYHPGLGEPNGFNSLAWNDYVSQVVRMFNSDHSNLQ